MGSPYLFRPASSGGGSASGAAGINYLSAIYAGDTLTNINTYNDGASATPTDGTGGVVTGLTTALNTSTPLVGTSCVRFSKDAANRQGMGWSYDFSVDRISYEQSQPVFVQFYYRTSANYAASDLRVFVYDKDAGTLLNVQDISNNSGNIFPASNDALFTGVFYTTSASNDYRLIWHITSTNASAYDFDIDCFVASPDVVVPGAIVTEWQSFTPTGSWVTNTTYTGRYRRVGDTLEMDVRVATSGAPTSATLTINIPNGWTADTSKMTTTADGLYVYQSDGMVGDSGSRVRITKAIYNTTTAFYVAYDDGSGSITGVTQAAPITFGAGDFVELLVRIPISNWAASAALSTTEALFSTAKARYSGGTQTISVASATILNASTKTYDTLNSVTTGANWKFTAPRSGYYSVDAFVQYVSRTYADGNLIVTQLFKNGVYYSQDGGTEISGTPAIVVTSSLSDTVYLAKGDYLDVRAYNAGSVSTNTDVFQIAVTEQPDFSIFSTYGNFELLTATSSTKTPSASAQYQQLTGNSLSLTPGTWRLFGDAQFASSGGSPGYTDIGVGFFGANGADSGSQPTALNSTTGLTVLSAYGGANGTLSPYLSKTSTGPITATPVIVRVTQNVTVYMVTYTTASTPANARIIVYANAERLQ